MRGVDIYLPLWVALTPLLAFSLVGCARLKVPNRQDAAEARAWQTICAHAPHQAGQPIEWDEQRAMDRVGAWQMSVSELDAYCAKVFPQP